MNRRDLLLLSPAALLLTGCGDKPGDLFRSLKTRAHAGAQGSKIDPAKVPAQCYAIYIALMSLYAPGPGDTDTSNPHVDALEKYPLDQIQSTQSGKAYYPPLPAGTSLPDGYKTVYENIQNALKDQATDQAVRFGLNAFTEVLQILVGAAIGATDVVYPGGNPDNCLDCATIDALWNRGLMNVKTPCS